MIRFNGWQIATTLSLFFLCSHAAQYSYWVDQSCKSRTDWSVYLDEAFQMARRGSQRLNDDSDTDYQYVFKRMFGIDRNSKDIIETINEKDTPRKLVFNRLDSFQKEWSETNDRLDSDVRLYCNNAARWRPAKNRPGKIIDPDNKMSADDPHPCHKPGSKARGATSVQRLKIKDSDPQQNEDREVIDFCDYMFQVPNTNFPIKLAAVPDTKDLTQLDKGIQYFQRLASKTILHEFLHTNVYQVRDLPANGLTAYGWPNLIAKASKDALDNAENFAIYSAFAMIADRPVITVDDKGKKTTQPGGLTLTRSPDPNAKQEEKDQNEKDVQAGKFKWYKDLTGSKLASKRRARDSSWIRRGFAA